MSELSKPKEYIDILLKDLIKTLEMAVKNYYEERYNNMCSSAVSSDKLQRAMDKVDEIKKEIFYVMKIAVKNGFED